MDTFVREIFDEIKWPMESVYSVYLDVTTIVAKKSTTYNIEFKNCENKVSKYKYIDGISYFDILVPNLQSVKYSALIEYLLLQEKNVFLTGETGTGKTVIIEDLLRKMKVYKNKTQRDTIAMTFSAQTSSNVA